MPTKLKIRRRIRVFLDEELQNVTKRDDEGNPVLDNGVEVTEEEMVTVVRTIGKGDGDFPEPEEGTVFQLGLMRFADAMKFSNFSQDKRVKALDDYSSKAIVGWDGLLDEDNNELPFDVELIEFIPTFQRLYLVMEAVNKSVGDRKRGNG